jgi:hypothetical protein
MDARLVCRISRWVEVVGVPDMVEPSYQGSIDSRTSRDAA